MQSSQSVWDKVLHDNETIEYEFSIGDQYIKFGLIIWGIISFFLLAAMGLGIITFLIAWFYYGFYLKKANFYAFTNRRVLIHTGWLSTQLITVDYDKITDATVQEPFIDKHLTHTGRIAIQTAGSSKYEVVLLHVAHPYEIRKRLDKIRDAATHRV